MIAFGFLLANAADERMRNISAVATVFSGASLIYFIFNFYLKRPSGIKPIIVFVLLSAAWLFLSNFVFAISLLVFAVAAYYTSKKFELIVSRENIIYPSFPPKIFTWQEVSNAMIKDNVLTIDLKNNKLIQAVIEKESADTIDEEAFNAFCAKCLSVSL